MSSRASRDSPGRHDEGYREYRVLLFSIPGVENLSQTTVTIMALLLALALVAFFGLILRRLTSGRLSLKTDRGRARQPRLGIVDVYDLDRQRQLILLRRDNVEHLLLVGGPNDVVVETNIVRAGGSRLPVTPADAQDRADQAERNVEIAPVRPVLEPIGMRPPEPVAARLGTSDTMARGAIEPALKPSSVSAANSPRPAERGIRPNGSTPPGGGAAMSSLPIPRQTSSAVETARPDMAKQLEEALARPAPEPRPAPARTLDLPRATPVAQPGRSMSPLRKSEPAPTPGPRAIAEPAPVAEPAPPSSPIPGPVEIHAEVAEAEVGTGREEPVRQEPVRQEPVRPESVRTETAHEELADKEPGRRQAGRQESDRDEALGGQDIEPETVTAEALRPEPVREKIEEETELERGEVPASPPVPAEMPVRTFQRPVQVATPAAPIIVPASPPPSQAASPARNDPFSIEDIEAEFARLLGRPMDKRDDRT